MNKDKKWNVCSKNGSVEVNFQKTSKIIEWWYGDASCFALKWEKSWFHFQQVFMSFFPKSSGPEQVTHQSEKTLERETGLHMRIHQFSQTRFPNKEGEKGSETEISLSIKYQYRGKHMHAWGLQTPLFFLVQLSSGQIITWSFKT